MLRTVWDGQLIGSDDETVCQQHSDSGCGKIDGKGADVVPGIKNGFYRKYIAQ